MSLNQVQQVTDQILGNTYVSVLLKVGILLYAAQLAPKLNDNITVWFANTWVKLAFLFIVLYLGSHDLILSAVFACIIVFGINYFSRGSWKESFDSTFSNFPFAGTPQSVTILEPQSEVLPGCGSITMKDLLAAFDGDLIKLQASVNHVFKDAMMNETETDPKKRLEKYSRLSGVPFNVEINDDNAPLISSYLIMYGFQFPTDSTCSPPGA